MKLERCFGILLCLVALTSAAAQDAYRIGIDDRLQINVWQEPDLAATVRVGQDGKITLPLIGEVMAAGLTTSELARKIVQQISFYNPAVSQATVVVIEYNSQFVVLSGAVNNPGRHAFEKIPNLLDVLSAAGGATATADLTRVSIIRQENGRARVIDVDLVKYIRDGNLADLPPLQAKDIINVPDSPYGVAAQQLVSSGYKGKDIYFIYGAVAQPGVKNISEGLDLVDAIASAGGIVAAADIKNIRLVSKEARYSTVMSFNLEKYNKEGKPARYIIRPEDTIFIPFQPTTTSFINRLPEILIPGIITTVVTTILVRELN